MANFVFVDSEINGKKQIVDLGAVSDSGATFHRNDKASFTSFVRPADYIVGHNILGHDIKYIDSMLPDRCEIIDTLYLSPLLFPKKPYHRLVKDDKIETDDVNNPLSDSIKCRDLYYDEVAAFKSLPKQKQDIFGELLYGKKEFAGFFHSVSWKHSFFANAERLIRDAFRDFICLHADVRSIIKSNPIELAYALALIDSNDQRSITPGWVLHAYPAIQDVFHAIRMTNCHDPKCPYCSSVFSAKAKLKEFFGYDDFRTFEGENLQERAVNYALEGKSLLAIFPTGGGKSLTFQLPALIAGEATRGLTVVISPLQSLMKDQVDNLEKKNIVGAVSINGMLSPIERSSCIEQVFDGNASLLYIAPESLRSKTIEKLLLSRDIARIVIDEAHCFSSWGQDFRVDYLFIGSFIKSLQSKKGLDRKIPVSCFTATAKPKVISDICAYFREELEIELEVLASKASRTNLRYKVLYQEDDNAKYQTLRELLSSKRCPSIVYVSRTRSTVMLAERLSQDSIPAVPFHGKMDPSEKTENQNLFMENKVQVIVATNAFGMGVDKSDVQLVIHYEISDSLENYVQEAGRAGRDQSLQAECYVLFNKNDLDKHFLLLNQTKITINEIQQVWRAIKSLTSKTRNSFSASGLEIARRAGWDEETKDIETRVRTALAALEQSGYIQRKMNSPHVFASGVLVDTMIEAEEMINSSPVFVDDKEKTYAKRIIKSIISAHSIAEARNEDAESRIDYLSDRLGIPKMDVVESISKMRQTKILADTLDMYAYIRKTEENKTTNVIARFARLERFMAEEIFEIEGEIDLKELNDKAIREGVKDATVKNMRTILFYWSIKGLVKCKRNGNLCMVEPQREVASIRKKIEIKLDLAARIADYLFSFATDGSQQEELIQFSLLKVHDDLKSQPSLLSSDTEFDESDVKDALLYLNKIDAIELEGGFLVFYNSLNVERLVTDNHIQYKQDDYKELANFYKMKTQQIHIVGEFASMMLTSYDDALTYVKDYFSLEYEAFLKKYFKGRKRTGEIQRNITPEKYDKLFGNLSEIQKKIIDDDESQYIAVLAGPGSGKTRVLVHKLASLLLLEDVKSEQLLMLTFSRMAAREFKSRLRELIGGAVNYVDIKTFHSYCFDLLGRLGNEEEFDDVVKKASEMIASGEVEEEKIAKTVLVIDEAQDIDEEEYGLIKALIARNPEIKIIAVGDDDQNIFEFRGSDSKYLGALIEDYGATRYEMVENYRSKRRIVELSNRFAHSIKDRIKSEDIVPISQEDGHIALTRHTSKNLEEPLCKELMATKLTGTTAILTISNDSALKCVGILTKAGIKTKLIQSDEGLNLSNLAEFRYFMVQLSKCESPIISEQAWAEAKSKLVHYAESSAVLPKAMKAIEAFEKENKQIYKNDFQSFISESSFSDFETESGADVIVSTIHKAKGREYDNVFLLLDKASISTDEDKRKVYVGLTRAKTNLFIHSYGKALCQEFKSMGVRYEYDETQYEEPEEMEIQLGYRDVNLGLYEKHKELVLSLRSGQKLIPSKRGLMHGGKRILAYSRAFREDVLEPILEKGYYVSDAEIRYIVAWKNPEKPDSNELAVILPNIHLRKGEAPSQSSLPEPEEETEEQEIAAEPKQERKADHTRITSVNQLNDDQIERVKQSGVFGAFRKLRLKLAESAGGMPAYIILTDKMMIDILIKNPTTKDDLRECMGMSQNKINQYGDAILDLLRKYKK